MQHNDRSNGRTDIELVRTSDLNVSGVSNWTGGLRGSVRLAKSGFTADTSSPESQQTEIFSIDNVKFNASSENDQSTVAPINANEALQSLFNDVVCPGEDPQASAIQTNLIPAAHSYDYEFGEKKIWELISAYNKTCKTNAVSVKPIADRTIFFKENEEVIKHCQETIAHLEEMITENPDENPHFELLGRGSFGAVYRVTRSDIAVKILDMGKTVTRNEIEGPWILEGCAGIPQVFGVGIFHTRFFIFQEFCGLSLSKLARENDFQDFLNHTDNMYLFTEELFQTVQGLGDHGVVHRDIKGSNICALRKDGKYVPRLVDWGSCQTKQDKTHFNSLTLAYLPPKIVKVRHSKLLSEFENTPIFFDEEVDSYCMAMALLCLLLKKCHPIPGFLQLWKRDEIQARVRLINLTQDDVDGWFLDCNHFFKDERNALMKKILHDNLNIKAVNRLGAKKTVELLNARNKSQPEASDSRRQTSPSSHLEFQVKSLRGASPETEDEDQEI